MYYRNQYQINPLRYFLARYQAALVVVMGFASAFLLGLLLWNLTSAVQISNPVVNVSTALEELAVNKLPGIGGGEAAHDGDDAMAVDASGPGLSPVFSPEVQHWEAEILNWANLNGLDPNLAATVMQIESCGNPQAISRAGARGLFQVMPFHFDTGEDMLDPDTNATRGMAYLVQGLALTENDTALALASYNGGHGIIQKSWEAWPAETQRYYRWGGGIYAEASSGLAESPTLNDWFAAGGNSLCVQAAAQLGLQP